MRGVRGVHARMHTHRVSQQIHSTLAHNTINETYLQCMQVLRTYMHLEHLHGHTHKLKHFHSLRAPFWNSHTLSHTRPPSHTQTHLKTLRCLTHSRKHAISPLSKGHICNAGDSSRRQQVIGWRDGKHYNTSSLKDNVMDGKCLALE